MGTLASSTNKTDCHDITEILLKVALNTITITQPMYILYMYEKIQMQIIKVHIKLDFSSVFLYNAHKIIYINVVISYGHYKGIHTHTF